MMEGPYTETFIGAREKCAGLYFLFRGRWHGDARTGSYPVTRYAIALVIVCIYSITTFRRIPVWKDDVTLWQTAAADFPTNYTAHFRAGEAYYQEKRWNEAEQSFVKARKLNPAAYGNSSHYLGLIYYQQKKLNEAEAEFTNELKMFPDNVDALYNIAIIKMDQDHWEASAPFLEMALKNADKGMKIKILNMIAVVYSRLERYSDAQEALSQARQLGPNNEETVKNLNYLNKLMPSQYQH